MQPVRIAIVGLGKIAREEHIPAIAANAAFELVATAGPATALPGIVHFASVEAMLEDRPDVEAVAVCTPPQAHYAPAKAALLAGKHVLLEKPPCPTLEEFEDLVAIAQTKRVSLFQTWHARETPGMSAAAAWLAKHRIKSGRVIWKEDVRHWHPGQSWIWSEGGFGVLDAGINALSILTAILPGKLIVEAAHLLVPANTACPVAVGVSLITGEGAVIDAEFDFRHRGIQARSVQFDTDAGGFDLAQFSASQGEKTWGDVGSQSREYAALYNQFAQLIADGRSDTDGRPLELVLEIFRRAGRSTVAPFRE